MSSLTSIIITVLFLFQVIKADAFCSNEGCVPPSTCTCPSFWSSCNTNINVHGQCDLTTYGIVALCVIILTILLIILTLCCICWCCCCGACKRGRDTNVHTHVHPYITTQTPYPNIVQNV